MDTTMIQADDPTLHVGMIGGGIWADAVEQIADGRPPVGADPDDLAFWEAAGILADGELDPLWGEAIDIARTSRRGVEVVSRYGDVVFAATLLVSRDRRTVTCATTRATVAVNTRGVEEVDAVHPMLEIAIAGADRAWQLIRRVLPPLDELRHEPRATAESEAVRVTLDGVEIPPAMQASPELFAAHLLELPNLPRGIVDAMDPRAAVFTYALLAEGEGPRSLGRTWVLGERLHLIDADTASIWRVPAGDLGSTLVRTLLGD